MIERIIEHVNSTRRIRTIISIRNCTTLYSSATSPSHYDVGVTSLGDIHSFIARCITVAARMVPNISFKILHAESFMHLRGPINTTPLPYTNTRYAYNVDEFSRLITSPRDDDRSTMPSCPSGFARGFKRCEFDEGRISIASLVFPNPAASHARTKRSSEMQISRSAAASRRISGRGDASRLSICD